MMIDLWNRSSKNLLIESWDRFISKISKSIYESIISEMNTCVFDFTTCAVQAPLMCTSFPIVHFDHVRLNFWWSMLCSRALQLGPTCVPLAKLPRDTQSSDFDTHSCRLAGLAGWLDPGVPRGRVRKDRLQTCWRAYESTHSRASTHVLRCIGRCRNVPKDLG